MRSNTTAHLFSRYGVAITLTALALFLRWLLLPLFGSSTPFIVLAVAVSAWYGGLGPGLTTTFTYSLFIALFPSLWINSATTSQFPLIISVLVIGSMISGLIESLHRAQSKTEMDSARLAESNERFHLLVDSVKDYGIFMLDTQGVVTSWSAGARQIKGYEAEEIIGQHFSRFYPAEDIAAGKPELELRVATTAGRFEEEGWRLRKDGSRFWVNVVATAVYDNQGELRGFSKVIRDMTERRKSEEQNHLLIREQAARVEAENANKAKDQFLAILSHELRTPLNTIGGWAYLLKNGFLSEQEMRDACGSIERSSKLQIRLIEDLLDVSRMLSGKLSVEKNPTELTAIAEAAISEARFSSEAKNIELKVHHWPTPLIVLGDAMRLQQVVSNLLQNSIKFTAAGGHVVIDLCKDGEQAEIKVHDNGSGISAAAIPHIFEHFHQADSSATRKHGGLGLGLAIVRYVVEAHGGTVHAQSDGEGEGSTFIVRLPLLDEAKLNEAKMETSPTEPRA